MHMHKNFPALSIFLSAALTCAANLPKVLEKEPENLLAGDQSSFPAYPYPPVPELTRLSDFVPDSDAFSPDQLLDYETNDSDSEPSEYASGDNVGLAGFFPILHYSNDTGVDAVLQAFLALDFQPFRSLHCDDEEFQRVVDNSINNIFSKQKRAQVDRDVCQLILESVFTDLKSACLSFELLFSEQALQSHRDNLKRARDILTQRLNSGEISMEDFDEELSNYTGLVDAMETYLNDKLEEHEMTLDTFRESTVFDSESVHCTLSAFHQQFFGSGLSPSRIIFLFANMLDPEDMHTINFQVQRMLVDGKKVLSSTEATKTVINLDVNKVLDLRVLFNDYATGSCNARECSKRHNRTRITHFPNIQIFKLNRTPRNFQRVRRNKTVRRSFFSQRPVDVPLQLEAPYNSVLQAAICYETDTDDIPRYSVVVRNHDDNGIFFTLIDFTKDSANNESDESAEDETAEKSDSKVKSVVISEWRAMQMISRNSVFLFYVKVMEEEAKVSKYIFSPFRPALKYPKRITNILQELSSGDNDSASVTCAVDLPKVLYEQPDELFDGSQCTFPPNSPYPSKPKRTQLGIYVLDTVNFPSETIQDYDSNDSDDEPEVLIQDENEGKAGSFPLLHYTKNSCAADSVLQSLLILDFLPFQRLISNDAEESNILVEMAIQGIMETGIKLENIKIDLATFERRLAKFFSDLKGVCLDFKLLLSITILESHRSALRALNDQRRKDLIDDAEFEERSEALGKLIYTLEDQLSQKLSAHGMTLESFKQRAFRTQLTTPESIRGILSSFQHTNFGNVLDADEIITLLVRMIQPEEQNYMSFGTERTIIDMELNHVASHTFAMEPLIILRVQQVLDIQPLIAGYVAGAPTGMVQFRPDYSEEQKDCEGYTKLVSFPTIQTFKLFRTPRKIKRERNNKTIRGGFYSHRPVDIPLQLAAPYNSVLQAVICYDTDSVPHYSVIVRGGDGEDSFFTLYDGAQHVSIVISEWRAIQMISRKGFILFYRKVETEVPEYIYSRYRPAKNYPRNISPIPPEPPVETVSSTSSKRSASSTNSNSSLNNWVNLVGNGFWGGMFGYSAAQFYENYLPTSNHHSDSNYSVGFRGTGYPSISNNYHPINQFSNSSVNEFPDMDQALEASRKEFEMESKRREEEALRNLIFHEKIEKPEEKKAEEEEEQVEEFSEEQEQEEQEEQEEEQFDGQVEEGEEQVEEEQVEEQEVEEQEVEEEQVEEEQLDEQAEEEQAQEGEEQVEENQEQAQEGEEAIDTTYYIEDEFDGQYFENYYSGQEDE